MRTIRWLFFIPASAGASILFALLWNHFFPDAYFSKNNLFIGIRGGTPLFLGRFLAIVFFIILATAIAPKRGRVQIAILGTLSGICGWPLGPQYYTAPAGFVFYMVEVLATIIGAAIGMLLSFSIFREKMDPQANKSGNQ